MTQTSPKPADQTNINEHDPELATNDHVGVHTPLSFTEEAGKMPTLHKSNSVSLWQQLSQRWGNLSLQTKLTILLMVGAAVPVIAVTQGLASISQKSAKANVEATLRSEASSFVNDYLLWLKGESAWQAHTIAQTVQAANIDLQQPAQVEPNTKLLRTLVSEMMAAQDKTRPDFYKSFRIITNTQGKTVAQYIQTHADYPLGSSPKSETIIQQVSLPTGIDLGDIPIIKDAMITGRSLTGVELLEGKFLQRLGLDRQATVNLQSQPTQGLPKSEQPFPQGTYRDVDDGKHGLVTMAVEPIKVQNKVVGLAVVGLLLNKSHSVVDAFGKTFNKDITLFARDLRVSTTIHYKNTNNRAIGTRAAREVAEAVLNQGKEFFGQTNVTGKEYLTDYTPLYDHQKELNPTAAKPTGMAIVGTSLEQVDNTTNTNRQQLLGYSLGVGISLLAALVAIPIAGSFSRPIRRLARFAQQVGEGKQGVRLETTERSDEIGVLSQELNQMAASIEANFEARRQEAERTQLFADIASSHARESQELNSVFNKAVLGAREVLKAERVVVYRFYPDWSGYITAESVADGWPQALGDKIEDSCIGNQLIQAYRKGRVVPTEDVFAAGFHPEHLQLMERLQIKANLVTPIVNGDQLFGLLIAHHCSQTHAWQQSEIDFLRQLANQLGLILDRVSLLERQQVEAQRSRLVKDITVKLAQFPQTEEIFNTAVQEIRSGLQSDRVVVYSFNDKWQGTVISEAVADGWPCALGAQIDDPCFAERYVEKYRQGRVQATENIHTAGLGECHLKQLEQFAVKANLVAPILRNGQLLGLLIAHQCSAPRAWQQGEINMFAQLATQVGFALDRATLLEQQKAAKEQLQKRALELLMEVDPVSSGDLTIRASVTEDEIGTIADSYNATVANLRKIVTQVQAAATQVTATTSSNEVSVSELSQEALRQAQEIAVTLERIQEMSNSIRAVAGSAKQAEAAVQEANQTVEAGDAAMNRTVEGILAIRETVAVTSKKVKRLGESSQKISKVVNLIGTFANQTNLLALNAAIEAANAGEQGRGFAVVADQVRALSRQSAQATAEIERLVMEIQTETNEVVAAMEAGTTQVVEGTKLVDETRQSLNKITAVSTQISALVAGIAAAATAQSQTSVAVTQSISDVAASANQNSHEATLVSASFKELLTVATELQASVGQFKVN